MSEPRQSLRMSNLSADFWQRQGDIGMQQRKDIYPDDEARVGARGLFARMANRYGPGVYTDHFRSGVIPAGFAWQVAAPFDGVPPVLDYSYRGSYLRAAGDNTGNDYFLADTIATYDGKELTARIHVGHNTRCGLRIDDGSDNNFVRYGFWSDDQAGQWLYYSHRTGGGGVVDNLLNAPWPHDEYHVLRLLRSGGNTYGWLVGEEGDSIYAVNGTNATAWVPTRVGFHFWSSNGHLFYCDWFYSTFS